MKSVEGPKRTSLEPTPCPMPEFDAVESDYYENIDPFEQAVFERLNESRASQNLDPVEWDEVLAYIARLHSRNMSRNDFFGHEDPTGRGPSDRIKEFNYDCNLSYAEIIYTINGFESVYNSNIKSIGEEAVDWWKNSPPHREAMWSTTVEVAGVGCYINEDNDVYVTCKFCTHDPADAEDAGTGTPPEDCYYGGERP